MDLTGYMHAKNTIALTELNKVEDELLAIYGTFWTHLFTCMGDPIIEFYKDLNGDTINWTLSDHETAKYNIEQLGVDFDEEMNAENFDSREYYRKIYAYINKNHD